MTRSRRAVFALAAVSCSMLVMVGVGEIACRIFYRGPLVTGSLVVSDPELSFKLRKGCDCRGISQEYSVKYVIDNELGLRVHEPGATLPAYADIVVYGDSFVFGHGVDFADVFTVRMEVMLPGKVIVNAGIFNYGPDQEYLLAKRLRPRFKSGLEIACFFAGNDFSDFNRFHILGFSREKIYPIPPRDPAGNLRRKLTALPGYGLLCRFYLWHWFKRTALENRRMPVPDAVPAASGSDGTVTLSQAARALRIARMYQAWQRQVTKDFLLVIIPAREFRGKPTPELSCFKQYLTRFGVRFIDLGEQVTPAELMGGIFQGRYYERDMHWNAKGHQWGAKMIAAAVCGNGSDEGGR